MIVLLLMSLLSMSIKQKSDFLWKKKISYKCNFGRFLSEFHETDPDLQKLNGSKRFRDTTRNHTKVSKYPGEYNVTWGGGGGWFCGGSKELIPGKGIQKKSEKAQSRIYDNHLMTCNGLL